MKKILLFMLPIMALCLASCEKNNENELSGDDIIQFEDAHFLHALLCVQEISMLDAELEWIMYMVDVDRNRDGQISVNEAQNVLGLEFESFNVYSMPEIKYFTSLRYLVCHRNQLTTLALSNNAALIYLCCYSNQLTTLDLSNNAALKILYCYNNQLTSLNLSKDTALLELDCSDNQLTTLDLSKNTALEWLDCYSNQLTTLDLSNNAALISLDCFDNQLATLDLSKNIALESLDCSGNPLTKIILPRNNRIKESDIQNIIEEYGDIIEYR